MPDFHPYVPGTVLTRWYQKFEKSDKAWTMWTMWFVYYMHINELYSVISNLGLYTGRTYISFVVHRMEIGLHTFRKYKVHTDQLLKAWDNRFIIFPTEPVRLDWDGSHVSNYTRY